MPVKINGSTSGSTTITAPATGTDETIELSTALAAKATTANFPSGAWSAYTPSFSGASIGNATVTFAYTQLGKTVHVRGSVTFGSTTSFTGPLDISLPVNVKSAYIGVHPIGCANAYDISGSVSICQPVVISPSQIRIIATLTNGAWATNAEIGVNNPFTWATGDYLFLSLTYEAA